MLTVKTKVKESKIHGLGLFADQFIPKGTVIFKFTPGFDLKFTKEQILSFPELIQIYFCKYSWKSEKSKLYCFHLDDGRYINHSNDSSALSEYKDGEEEIVTIAIKDIVIGEEITDNYSSFEDGAEYEADADDDNVLIYISKKYNLVDELDPRQKRKK